jgi:hypothetical protein
MGDSERYRGRREIFAGNEILQPCSLRDRHGVDGTKSPVDRVPGGRRIGMFRGQAATTWPCGSAFPIWWPSTRSRPVVIEDHHWRRRETAEAVRRRRVPPPSNWFIVGSPMFDERKRAGSLTG